MQVPAFAIPGPAPHTTFTINLSQEHINHLVSQGQMIGSSTTDAYLSLLVRPYWEHGIRRANEFFYHFLSNSDGDWEKAKTQMDGLMCGGQLINWETDPLIFIPIAFGAHFSLLVLDRIRFDSDVFVHFDSLPMYHHDVLERIKDLLKNSPFLGNGTRWIKAKMPTQAAASNDCGIFMSLCATIYLRDLKEKCLIPATATTTPTADLMIANRLLAMRGGSIAGAELTCGKLTEKQVGEQGRQHMLRSFRDLTVNSLDEPLTSLRLSFL
jgi:Ulp1 family protease